MGQGTSSTPTEINLSMQSTHRNNYFNPTRAPFSYWMGMPINSKGFRSQSIRGLSSTVRHSSTGQIIMLINCLSIWGRRQDIKCSSGSLSINLFWLIVPNWGADFGHISSREKVKGSSAAQRKHSDLHKIYGPWARDVLANRPTPADQLVLIDLFKLDDEWVFVKHIQLMVIRVLGEL